MENSFTVLVVCTGNICRSPLAELLLRKELAQRTVLRVTSAGTRAVVDSPMDPTSREIAEGLGIVEGIKEHRAQQLQASLAEGADLILTMTREQRREVVQLTPRSTKKAFTLREFARLATATKDDDLSQESSEAACLRASVRAAALTRSDILPPLSAAEDEVIDPYHQAASVYAESTRQLVPAIEAVVSYFQRVLELTAK